MQDTDHEPEGPDAGPSKDAGNQGDAPSDSDDDAAPDYSQLSSLAARALQRESVENELLGEETIAPFIPKRGEKDFEPTGFEAQARALEKSRKAMFDVIKCERMIGSKSISIATWEPSLNRAVVELARGSLFASIGLSRRVPVLADGRDEDLERCCNPQRTNWTKGGVWKNDHFFEKARSRLELLPEEALYLVERGSLECRVKVSSARVRLYTPVTEKIDYEIDSDGERDWVPMSVQQAFSTMMGKEGLTRERYQLYAYLKRLGYIVQRKSVTDDLRLSAQQRREQAATEQDVELKSVVQDPRHPLRLVTVLDVLLYPLRRICQIGHHLWQHLSTMGAKALYWIRSVVFQARESVKARQTGRGLLSLGGRTWNRYETVFDQLGVVPCGHDTSLPPRRSGKCQNHDEEVPEIFFYAWRPATRFKKTDPPMPEYRFAVVDARHTSLLSAFAFEILFQQIPISPDSDDLDGLDEEEQREWKRAMEEKKRNDESYGRGAVKKLRAEQAATRRQEQQELLLKGGILAIYKVRLWTLLSRVLQAIRFFNHCCTLLPPGCASSGMPRRGPRYTLSSRTRPQNIFPPLKAGRRNVIVAINDCGTTSLVRFGEAEFDRWKLAGSQ